MRVVIAAASALLALAPVATQNHGHPDVESANTPSGPILADRSGATLYVFVDDLLTKAPSACTGDCENDWHPALVSGRVTVGSGVTGHIGSEMRSDGERQLTMDGRPLYTFAGDHRLGDVRGNGVGNIWWAMTPSGLSATSLPVLRSNYGPPTSTTITIAHATVGAYVANDRGQALYAYADDTPTRSACISNWCLVDWPPLQTAGRPTVAVGIERANHRDHRGGRHTTSRSRWSSSLHFRRRP